MVKLVRFDVVHLIAILSLFSYYCNSVGQGMEGQHKLRPCKAGQHAPIHGAGRGWDKATTLQSTHDPACPASLPSYPRTSKYPLWDSPIPISKEEKCEYQSMTSLNMIWGQQGAQFLQRLSMGMHTCMHVYTHSHALSHMHTPTYPANSTKLHMHAYGHIHALADIHIHNHTHNHM